ncbi:RNase P/RNase MRP subunit p29 [Caldisphaera lagunensis DSM 15908]|uniref:Ribonuclease P protein component 1 n=1 Tax=Caldisphaera lagunensis (strain DSM 15908 / JCM 11604 / ANMR 0165 / IC-154) TaxID=1056495 RepID=L0ACD2_CALLD|nr:ribonuclease P protein subunit [Caldisphaera lagunensis]AFZ71084.1 RNase P/RNase MRP subunit p29 [Caldisphaera lagunensis DSM 15908]
MKINKKNLIYHEIIGLYVCIVKHLDPSIEGKCGKILYETKNTIIIETNKGKATILKKGAIFEIKIDNERVVVLGDNLIGRPEDRIKKILK